MSKERELLFSVKKEDFKIETFRCGGKGGQNVNKVETGVRIKHLASGAVAEGRVHRTQLQNKKFAFEQLIAREEFKKWHRLECAKYLSTYVSIDDQIEEALKEKNLKIEVRIDGKWVEVKFQDISYEEVFEGG